LKWSKLPSKIFREYDFLAFNPVSSNIRHRFAWLWLALSAVGVASLACKKAAPQDANYAMRTQLLAELQPIVLKNCTFRRYGGTKDEGYLMCGNLLQNAKSAYSYGIAGRDAWGCEISTEFKVPVHQYDCFDHRKPVCESGKTHFNPECIGDKTEPDKEKRQFSTLTAQIQKNGDAGKTLVVKMDVEGAEWPSLAATPDSVFEKIDQIAIEFHKVNDPNYLELIKKLKRNFYFVHLHFNNHACTDEFAPFPAWAFQALLVNKKIGVPDPANPKPQLPHPLDVPDNVGFEDCQTSSS
jgi:hypothetical protein